MSVEIGALVLILGSIDLYGKNRSFACRGKTPGSVTCDVTTEGRTVQAAACRAAVYGFDSHPRLQNSVGAPGSCDPSLEVAWGESVAERMRDREHADSMHDFVRLSERAASFLDP